jgi:hypothetical protein
MVRRLIWCVFLALPSSALAQGDCFPPDDSNEAKVFATFGVPLAFGPAEAPHAPAPWSARFALETSYIPNIDDETATPTVCRPGKGPENTNFASILPRPRVSVGLPAGLAVEVSWVPPISMNGATPNLLGFSLGRTFTLGRAMELGVRLHASTGKIEAPITCDEEALQDPVSECFNGTESDDRYKPNAFGADITAGWSLGGGRVRPFVGAGVNLLRPRFQVHFVNQFDQLDNRKVEVDLERFAMFAGATWFPTPRLGLTGQIYSAPADAVTGRLTISYGR